MTTSKQVFVSEFMNGVIPTSEKSVFALPPGAYYIRVFRGTFYLEPTSPPQRPKNVYGTSVRNRADRIFNDFMSNNTRSSIGALFVGQAGSGKTLMMQELAAMALEQNQFVFILDVGFGGAEFNSFLHDALGDLPAVVLIDEIEKKYKMLGESDEDSPNGLASLLEMLQGVKSSKKLFLGTANSASALSTYLINRPGRIKYMVQFNGLDAETVTQYIFDHIENRNLANELRNRMLCQQVVTFDILQAVCAEVRRMGDVKAALKDLNVVDTFGSATFTIQEVRDDNNNVYQFADDAYYQPQRNEAVRVQFSPAQLCTRFGVDPEFFRREWAAAYGELSNENFERRMKQRNIQIHFRPDPDATLENIEGQIRVEVIGDILRSLRGSFDSLETAESLGSLKINQPTKLTALISRNRSFASAF